MTLSELICVFGVSYICQALNARCCCFCAIIALSMWAENAYNARLSTSAVVLSCVYPFYSMLFICCVCAGSPWPHIIISSAMVRYEMEPQTQAESPPARLAGLGERSHADNRIGASNCWEAERLDWNACHAPLTF